MWTAADVGSVEVRGSAKMSRAATAQVRAAPATAEMRPATTTAEMRSTASATTEMGSAATAASAGVSATASTTATLMGGQSRGCHAERKADRDRYRARRNLPSMRAFHSIPPSQRRTGSLDSQSNAGRFDPQRFNVHSPHPFRAI